MGEALGKIFERMWGIRWEPGSKRSCVEREEWWYQKSKLKPEGSSDQGSKDVTRQGMMRKQYSTGPHELKPEGLQRKIASESWGRHYCGRNVAHFVEKCIREGMRDGSRAQGAHNLVTEGDIFEKKNTCKHKIDYKYEHLLTIKTRYKFLRSWWVLPMPQYTKRKKKAWYF